MIDKIEFYGYTIEELLKSLSWYISTKKIIVDHIDIRWDEGSSCGCDYATYVALVYYKLKEE